MKHCQQEMTVIQNAWPVVCNFGWLIEADRNARKGKRYRAEVLNFTARLEDNLFTIQQGMMNGSYVLGPYRKLWVYVPKKRLVMALDYPDRIVQWSLYLYLNPIYDRLFIEDSYACRKDKGSHKAAKRLQYWMCQVQRKPGPGWYCLKLDISKYFYRVNHEKLLAILERRVKDPAMMAFIRGVVNSRAEPFGLPRWRTPQDTPPEEWLYEVGMPIGNLTSQLFANIYLNELDQYCKDTKECYDGATYTTINALFRAYDSWAESVADHSAFLLANKRYAAVVGERDYKAACKAIKAAGYATDPGYPQKLIGLIEKYGLTVYDGKAEQEDKTSMNISITKKTSTHNTTAAAGRAIRYIVVHYTAGVTSKPGSAAGTASYFGGTSKQVSADFIVDDGGAVQYNGDIRNRYTWHCGGGKYNTKGGAYYGKATNRNTIGIEVCSTNDTGKMTVANDSHWSFTDKVVSNLVELVKCLMAEYGIDATHVIRHYDVNGKPCPGIIGWNEDTGSAAKWAAFKARLGAATPGGQIGGSTNTGTATGNTALTYKVGDIVQFAGGKHYANAQATSGTTVKPGPAKVTAVATAGKHPYHLVHTDGTSTVYGWVDAAAITGKASATPAVKTYTVKAGDSLWRIAAQQLGNGARYKEIKTLNGLKNNTIHAGQVLKLPN